MSEAPSYEDLVEALARHVHKHLMIHTHRLACGGSPVPCFHHNYMSQFQIAASVLWHASVFERVSDSAFVFDCEPNEFRDLAAKYKSDGLDYDTVLLAVIGVRGHGDPKELDGLLVRCGLLERGADGHLTDTNKMRHYETLYDDWPSRIWL